MNTELPGELTTELVILGAGPAGRAAAEVAAERGVDCCLVDMNRQPGGQYDRTLPSAFGGAQAAPLPVGVHWLPGSTVWSIAEGYSVRLAGEHGVRHIVARQVILAPGAHDRPAPFPGWTLPGVMTAGGAQVLLKGQGVLPGRRCLVAGNGPLLLALAHQLAEAGAQVVAVCEANRPKRPWLSLAPRMWGEWARLRESIRYAGTLLRRGIPYLTGHVILRAAGERAVREATVCAVDRQGNPLGGSERTFEVDALLTGYGFVPNTELARLAGLDGCDAGGCPPRDAWMESSLPGLYLAGDGTAIGGHEVAMLEGRLAALAAGRRAGRIAPAEADRLSAPWRRMLDRKRSFVRALDAAFPAPGSLGRLVTDDTVVCRCEELTAGQIRAAIAAGATTVNAVKHRTRAGMGRCQGRMCRAAIEGLIEQETGWPVDRSASGVRPPILPVAVADLIGPAGADCAE